ncbi:MAG: DotU family type IV/VI secretion system protein [Pseudobdellovibrionaceae bacterium]|nr:DotU family type IV/VI secretion system protein [Halobacteriovoraceae bacterium]
MSFRFWPEISFCLNEVEKEKKLLTNNTLTLDTLSDAREKIAHRLELLKLSFEQDLSNQYSSLALFAILAYIDEDIQRHLKDIGKGNWDPIQKDFYGAHSAGELFFETIDKILDDPQVPTIVLEIFYFILKRGFLGKYRDSKTHINKYLDLMKEKIPCSAPIQTLDPLDEAHRENKYTIKTWHYYAGAGLSTLLLILSLYFYSY